MKLTYENKELIRITPKGNFRYKGHTYIYGGLCKHCKEPFLTIKSDLETYNMFCCKSCSTSGKYHPLFGKKLSIEHRKKIGKGNKGKTLSSETKKNLSRIHTGKNLSEETKQKLRDINTGKKHSVRTKQRLSKFMQGKHSGDENPASKGGVVKLGIPLYDTYGPKLAIFEEVRYCMLRIGCAVYKTLQVRCNESGCKKWFRPTILEVKSRLQAFSGTSVGSNNFYCSDGCKQRCATFGQINYPKGFKIHKKNRPGQAQWRKMVLERDKYTCQKCGFYSPTGKGLVAHHMEPVIQNPIESMDVDIGITFCIPCDKEVHKLPGCSPVELRCKKPKKPKEPKKI